jgi:hypothetical protein
LESQDGCADGITGKLCEMASEVWERMEIVEAEMKRYAQLYGIEEKVEEKTFVGRVFSTIV